jgi:hypothetical protein
MYAYLYDSMVTWYTRQNIGGRYVHFYAATTLTSMAFLNIASVVALCAHWNYAWAKGLLAAGANGKASAALGVALLAAHLFYSRWRRNASTSISSKGVAPQSRWVAGIYMLTSVVVFMYASTLVPPRT